MKVTSKKSPRNSTDGVSLDSYPIPAYLDFVPGGIDYDSGNNHYNTSASTSPSSRSPRSRNLYPLNHVSPDTLISKAYIADEVLRKYSIRYAAEGQNQNADPSQIPHRLPSLSILAEAVFGTLTGVQAASARKWADAMVLAYLNENDDENMSNESIGDETQKILSLGEDDLINEFENQTKYSPRASSPFQTSPNSPNNNSNSNSNSGHDLVSILKAMHQKQMEKDGHNNDSLSPLPVRPCGYVFKRNDIAWNCRTCQSDSTCVLCDTCFHNSNHEGHEVYFHRTSPGGCCDCGDLEAWKVEGCCPAHRPRNIGGFDGFDENMCGDANSKDDDMNNIETILSGISDEKLDFEAVKASLRGRADGEVCIKEMLPPRFAAVMGVVIGAAVHTVTQAVDGAAIGADPVQWTRRWSDQSRRLRDGWSHDEEYVMSSKPSCANSISDAMKLEFPQRFKLQLRLHNDDVHTYDEVIEALYRRRFSSSPTNGDSDLDTSYGLVDTLDRAKDLTTHVDTDGQVIVRSYSSIGGAMAGYDRLKSYGLHCSVISTPQLDLELRARVLLSWLSDIAAAHPAVASLVVHALVDVTEGSDSLGGTYIWPNSRIIPPWSFTNGYFTSTREFMQGEREEEKKKTLIPAWRRRMDVFPPNLKSSFLTREETRRLHDLGVNSIKETLYAKKGIDLNFYSKIPYTLPSNRYRKSPHSLWGVMPSPFTSPKKYSHPFLNNDHSYIDQPHYLQESLIVLDTDLRKQQETDTLIHDSYTHSLLGLYMISGVGLVDVKDDEHGGAAMKPTAAEWGQLLSISSYRAPVSPILLMLLFDPYPPKQLRGAIHPLILSMLVDSRMKSRFAASLGGIAYRPLTTLYCSGVGTEIDSPLAFTVQIFTTGSLVRALCNPDATKKLLTYDGEVNISADGCIGFEDAFSMPIAHSIVRCIHSNLLGECKEVKMVLKNTTERRTNLDPLEQRQRNKHLSALIYQQKEAPLTTLLPAAPDDAFLDARSTKHKRLPPLIRDLEYVFETPGTALRLLLHKHTDGENTDYSNSEIPHFPTMWCRLLRLAQGVDPQKRKISGGHVEYENSRWLEAYSLSLHFAGACSKFAESLSKSVPNAIPPTQEEMREGMGNCFVAILREMKWWLYKEYILDSGLPQTQVESQLDSLQRSTLHVSMATLGVASVSTDDVGRATALNCQTNIKMTEPHLEMIENAIGIEQSQYQLNGAGRGTIMGDWLRVPHSPHAGDTLSFHLPLHRSFARNMRSLCSLIVPEEDRKTKSTWWLLPGIDDCHSSAQDASMKVLEHPLSVLLRPSLRSSNCRVTWAAGPECNSEEAQRRRGRARTVSAAIAASKLIHSLCDHPLRCLAASEQISRHLWARNGTSAAGMALNYHSPPLCQSFRDLDLTMVQLSACGLSIGLGARRVFSLLLSRFDLDGFLCDPEKKTGSRSSNSNTFGTQWIMPPIMQDPDHAPSLAEALFSTLCVLVTELPPPPPSSKSDDSSMRMHVRRGLLHALAVNSLSYSNAMEAASNAITRKDSITGADMNEDGPTSFQTVFREVLGDIATQKSQGARSTAAPLFELKSNFSDEYDPTFFHLKRADHQHAMDNIARLRKQKFSSKGKRDTRKCLPLVSAPPVAHPRFLPCRMLLHIPALDAAIRRALIFALTGGEWLPPQPPSDFDEENTLESPSFSSEGRGRRLTKTEQVTKRTFSPDVVNNSSVSFLEVLQLLTLQVHTLEECANMHKTHSILDNETKALSESISINSYLGRLVHVPSSLVDVWALRCDPDGPLPSKGSGLNRGSILGLLIALYEHKSDNIQMTGDDSGHGGEDGLGGARFLVACGLRWLLRFVSALVQGVPNLDMACKSALEGIPPIHQSQHDSQGKTKWTIDDHLCEKVKSMLENLPDLWPCDETNAVDSNDTSLNNKNRETMKAAQIRAIEKMKKQQASFMLSITSDEKLGMTTKNAEEETDLCIICRCDDNDGENNGPLGFLGHVQRSRTLQLRCLNQSIQDKDKNATTYRVVGDMGCQIRSQKSMDSTPIECIPVGSLVTLLKAKVTSKYGVKSRRVLIRYVSPLDGKVSEGWASVESAQGYKILSPLVDSCYSNSRWGCTRPIIRQCGHAAHLGCVDAHVASIHQKAAQQTPFDGRFAAEIGDGEFLCPLCKQLCNIVVPVDEKLADHSENTSHSIIGNNMIERFGTLKSVLSNATAINNVDEKTRKAVKQYGTYLYQAMQINSSRMRDPRSFLWHKSLNSWDFKDDYSPSDNSVSSDGTLPVDDVLPLLRQQLIAWASAGHGAAAAEASTRGIKKSGFEPSTSDPWLDFNIDSRDIHPMLLELRRTLVAAASFQRIVSVEITEKLSNNSKNSATTTVPIVNFLLAQILDGTVWTSRTHDSCDEWSILTALLSSIPCHVSRDGTLSRRHEARATAAQIWVIKGVNMTLNESLEESNTTEDKESKLPTPFTPMCIRNIPNYQYKLPKSWGSMEVDASIQDAKVFRPALASGFLYIPLLSWDLNTFAGALFSTLLSSKDLASETFCDAVRILLVARMVQVLITPNALHESVNNVSFECDINVEKEIKSLVGLFQHCNVLINPDWKSPIRNKETDEEKLLYSVSNAVLPYARSLVLLLRASFSALRQRGYKVNSVMESFIEDEDTMYIEDGIYFMQKFGCPLPTEINDSLSNAKFWYDQINKWVTAVSLFDAYHGSDGRHLEFVAEKKNWVPIIPTAAHSNKKFKPDTMALIENEIVHDLQDNSMDVISDTFEEDTNGDEIMEYVSNEETQITQINLNPLENQLGIGIDFEDEEALDDDSDIQDDFGIPSLSSQISSQDNLALELIEEESVVSSSYVNDDVPADDDIYANVSSASIIPYQSSMIGNKKPGLGPRGSLFDYVTAATIMNDLSHLGVSHNDNLESAGLIQLPKSYVELYSLINKVKAAIKSSTMDDSDEFGIGETAICLITGTILKAGPPRRHSSRRHDDRLPGACTAHARKIGSGTGIFFLLQKCTVLLIHNKKSAYSPSLYVDENGEEDNGLRRGRPLYLNNDRNQALENLWRTHGIPREVAQIRSTSDRVIRDEWY